MDPMIELWLGAVLLLSCAARRSPPAVGVDRTRAPVGMRIQRLDQGLLVESVFPGTGADAAGLGPGDLVVQVDGLDVKGASKTAAFGLRGPAGSSVDLVVRAPLTGEYREILVERGVGSVVDAPGPALPDSVFRLRRALARHGPRAARRWAQAALDDGLGGP
ncbi:MAG: PDZ domain-containing protein, partial [Oligoflexia bacterium]|nr:PDZ domain-containing protein [Oligoflexia bacterium]